MQATEGPASRVARSTWACSVRASASRRSSSAHADPHNKGSTPASRTIRRIKNPPSQREKAGSENVSFLPAPRADFQGCASRSPKRGQPFPQARAERDLPLTFIGCRNRSRTMAPLSGRVAMSAIEYVLELFARHGPAAYLGEQVSQTEHALQAAALAEQAGAAPELIVAALLHDVGHLLDARAADPAR